MIDILNPTEEHRGLREMVRSFAEREVGPQAEEHDRTEQFNLELFRMLGELGLLGVTAPPEFGGSGMDATAAVIVNEELAAVDPGFCLAYLAHAILFVNNVAVNGDAGQHQKYLPPTCSGQWVGGMCMSEADAGSDVLGMKTVARQEGDYWVLNGRKMWITNGAVSETETGDVYLVYAKHNTVGDRDISLFIVERGLPGFSLGQKLHGKLGVRASTTAELVFHDCRVPAASLVGVAGKAVRSMMRNLAIERLTLAAMSLGIARRCIEIMNVYARERAVFGEPLHSFGQIQRHIAESYAEFMAGRSYVYNVAYNLKLDAFVNRIDTDGVKLFCSTMAKNVADRAIQVLGGYGYVAEYTVERLWRDAKLMEIGGGTNEVHQKNMTRDLGRIDVIR